MGEGAGQTQVNVGVGEVIDREIGIPSDGFEMLFVDEFAVAFCEGELGAAQVIFGDRRPERVAKTEQD